MTEDVRFLVDADAVERLREALDRARRSRFYGERLPAAPLASLRDLAALPLTRRVDLEDAGTDGLLAVPREELWQYHESSGTTGRLISTWYTRRDLETALVAIRRSALRLGPGRVLLNRLPYAFVALSHFLEARIRESGAAIVPAGNLNWIVPFPRALDLLKRLRPQILCCLPIEPLILRELAPDLGLEPRALDSLDTIFTAGGVLPPALRRLLEADWGARVVNIYGSTEALGIAADCAEGRLHLHTDLFVFEILDPRSLAPVPAGAVGVLVLTSLAGEAMPLVRYVTEDLVRTATGCPCGNPRPTVEVLGRTTEALDYGGAILSAYDVLDAAFEVAGEHGGRILFVIALPERLRFRIETGAWREGVGRESAARAAERLGVRVEVELVAPGELLPHPPLLEMPRGYKPALLSDWRRDRRHPFTLADAMLTRPDVRPATALRLAGWAVRSRIARWRLARSVNV